MNLSELKSLTTLQYDECKERAIRRVQRTIGDKPSRQQFQRELGRLWTVLDILAIVVFIPALFVSSVHIITHMGKLAADSYKAANLAQAGTIIGQDLYVAIHQWFMIPLAEGSMILFMVLFGLTKAGWRRWVYLALAVVALTFVAIANWQSGIGSLEAVLAPIFTIGIGLKVEHLIVQALERRAVVDKDYLKAMAVWEAATQDATKHPDYKPMLANELWQALMKPKGNQWAVEAPPGFKVAAVQREMARERWAYEQVEATTAYEPAQEVKPQKVAVPFGNIATGDHESIPMIVSANGNGGARIANN